jgi:hypothetical protein
VLYRVIGRGDVAGGSRDGFAWDLLACMLDRLVCTDKVVQIVHLCHTVHSFVYCYRELN